MPFKAAIKIKFRKLITIGWKKSKFRKKPYIKQFWNRNK